MRSGHKDVDGYDLKQDDRRYNLLQDKISPVCGDLSIECFGKTARAWKTQGATFLLL